MQKDDPFVTIAALMIFAGLTSLFVTFPILKKQLTKKVGASENEKKKNERFLNIIKISNVVFIIAGASILLSKYIGD